jgi:glucose/mannose transport system permease protein
MSNSRKKKNPIGRILIYFALIVATFFYIFPIYSAFNTSLKTNEELMYGPVKVTTNPTFENYSKAFETIKRPMLNTIIFTICATAISAFLGSMSGFAFAKLKFKGSSFILLAVVLGFYIAPQSILIPLVRFMGATNLYDTYAGLILTHVAYGVPITTLLFKNYFDTLPTQVLDSARIDGCSNIGAFFKIACPLSLPGYAVVSIFQFTNIWNEFLYGLTLTNSVDSMPLTVAIANLKGTTVAAWNVQMAGLLISILPVLILYLFLMELIVKGLLMGSVKG